jgi:ABC-type enterobactin transport system permease subunit
MFVDMMGMTTGSGCLACCRLVLMQLFFNVVWVAYDGEIVTWISTLSASYLFSYNNQQLRCEKLVLTTMQIQGLVQFPLRTCTSRTITLLRASLLLLDSF